MNIKGNEVQSHGFIWEKELLNNVYNVSETELKEINYTSKMDLPAKLNRLDNCDLSVKTTKSKNMVCMADCLRIFDAVSSGNPFHVIVIKYVQDTKTTKKVETITEINLTNSSELLFGPITRTQIEELNNAVKSVPQKRKPTKDEHNKMYSMRNTLQQLSGAIQFNKV